MSKVVMSLPKGMVRDSVTGGLLALVTYVTLQLVCALLVDKGCWDWSSCIRWCASRRPLRPSLAAGTAC